MNGLVEWMSQLPADRAAPIFILVAATLSAILSIAFIIGGLWALRGRPALRVPGCRRCDASQHGEGVVVPKLCTECGAAQVSPHSVRWVRFRKQPLTLLITAPVVLIGGTCVAVLLVRGFVNSVDARATRMRDTRELVAKFRASSAVNQAWPRGPLIDSAMSIEEVIGIAREGGAKGTEAFLSIVNWIGTRMIESQELDPAMTFLEAVAARSIPSAPFVDRSAHATPGDNSDLRTTSGWRSATLIALGALNANYPSVRERSRALAERLLPTPEILAPSCVRPGAPMTIRGAIGGEPVNVLVRILTISIDGATVWSLGLGNDLKAMGPSVNAPSAVGAHVLEVQWAVVLLNNTWPALQVSESEPILSGTTSHSFLVDAGPELLPRESLGKYERFDISSTWFFVERIDDVEQIQLVVQLRGGIAMEGNWDVERAGSWQHVGEQKVSDGSYFNRVILLEHTAEWPDVIRLRFTPSTALDAVVLPAPSTYPNLAFDVGRSLRGVLDEEVIFELSRIPAAQTGIVDVRSYLLKPDWWNAPAPR